MPHVRPNIAEMTGYVPGEQPRRREVHQAQHERESVPVLAEGEGGDRPRRASGLAEVSRPAGDGVSHSRRRAATASIPIGFSAATAATTFSRSSRGRSSARATWSASPTRATCSTARWPRFRAPRATSSTTTPIGRCPTSSPSRTIGCGWHSWRTRTARRARWCRPKQVAELADALPCPLLVDEAYVDFADTNCLSLVAENEKIMVARTLSKSYALAGLRFGYLVAQPQVISRASQSEGLVQLRRALDRRRDRGDRRPGVARRDSRGESSPRASG